ncbi:MAG TPA: hypothetical protein PKM73_03750 [Verrucomicrobiota bacterium]|nr:hypothetical protein [Verrucomicrobiota bacterium]HNU50825.1 hypothetical protein [Verrucomicrobiota bacterium]
MWFSRLRVWWTQGRFPEEIRISEVAPVDLEEVLGELAADILAMGKPAPANPVAAESAAPAPVPTASAAPAAGALEVGFVVALCNDLSRVKRNATMLSQAGTETKEIRGIRRAVERLDDALRGRGVEYFEKTGTRFDPRDIEFDPKGQPVVVPGLAQSRIGPCECPVVKLDGKIIQRAQGLVEVPAGGGGR